MNQTAHATATYHPATGRLHFWVSERDGRAVGATISKEALHYCFGSALDSDGDGATRAYRSHRDRIEEAVRRRREAGALEPVMLRESDFPKQEQRE